MKITNTAANIFSAIPAKLPEELCQTLLQHHAIRIERIVSKGHSTPTTQWYDQAWDEWVMLLQGQAIIRYEQNNSTFSLQTGHYLLIPAHTKHRVEWTQPDCNTIWLAIHLHELIN